MSDCQFYMRAVLYSNIVVVELYVKMMGSFMYMVSYATTLLSLFFSRKALLSSF